MTLTGEVCCGTAQHVYIGIQNQDYSTTIRPQNTDQYMYPYFADFEIHISLILNTPKTDHQF
jgi:hypothetical protein